MGILPKEFRNGTLIGLICNHRQNHFFETVLVRFDLYIVETEKDQGSHCPGALISVDKGMVPDNMEKVSGSHLEEVSVEEAPTEGVPGHGKSRKQETHVADTWRASVAI